MLCCVDADVWVEEAILIWGKVVNRIFEERICLGGGGIICKSVGFGSCYCV